MLSISLIKYGHHNGSCSLLVRASYFISCSVHYCIMSPCQHQKEFSFCSHHLVEFVTFAYTISYSGFLSRGINNRVRSYIAVLKYAVFNAPLLIVTWEIVKTAYHWWRMLLWDYFKQKGPLSDPKGSLSRTIPSAIVAHFHPEFLSRDKPNYRTRC